MRAIEWSISILTSWMPCGSFPLVRILGIQPEFIAAIQEKREPNASLTQLLPCMRVLGKLEQIVDPKRQAHA